MKLKRVYSCNHLQVGNPSPLVYILFNEQGTNNYFWSVMENQYVRDELVITSDQIRFENHRVNVVAAVGGGYVVELWKI